MAVLVDAVGEGLVEAVSGGDVVEGDWACGEGASSAGDQPGGAQRVDGELAGAGADSGGGVDVGGCGESGVGDELVDEPVVAAEDAPGGVDVGDVDAVEGVGAMWWGLRVTSA